MFTDEVLHKSSVAVETVVTAVGKIASNISPTKANLQIYYHHHLQAVMLSLKAGRNPGKHHLPLDMLNQTSSGWKKVHNMGYSIQPSTT